MEMIVVMKAGVTDDEVQRVVERVAELGVCPSNQSLIALPFSG